MLSSTASALNPSAADSRMIASRSLVSTRELASEVNMFSTFPAAPCPCPWQYRYSWFVEGVETEENILQCERLGNSKNQEARANSDPIAADSHLARCRCLVLQFELEIAVSLHHGAELLFLRLPAPFCMVLAQPQRLPLVLVNPARGTITVTIVLVTYNYALLSTQKACAGTCFEYMNGACHIAHKTCLDRCRHPSL